MTTKSAKTFEKPGVNPPKSGKLATAPTAPTTEPPVVSDIIGTVTREEYRSLKRRALELERTNTQYILVIPCDGSQNWCEMGDRSALLYKYKVCSEIGNAASLVDDGDSYYVQFTLGRIRTRGFSVVRRRLQKANLYAGEELRDRSVIFLLNKKYSETEMLRLTKLEQERQATINNITGIEVTYPALYRELMEILSRVKKLVIKNMDQSTRAVAGNELYGAIYEISKLYYKMSALPADSPASKQIWQQILNLSKDSRITLQILGEQRIVDRIVCAELGTKFNKLILEAEKRIK